MITSSFGVHFRSSRDAMNDFRAMELALIQEWQPKLNFPFICQFYHPRKGLLKKPQMSMNAQFGLATLWRRARHRFTPRIVNHIILSDRFQNRLTMWKMIHSLGSNTLSRFETTRFLRSNEGGLTMCYALRRLAQNIQEPFRSLAYYRQSILPFDGGRESPPLESVPCELLGFFPLTWKKTFDVSFDPGTLRPCHIASHAILLH